MTPELQKIHETSMAILSKVGMIFGSPEVRDIVSSHGVKVSGRKIFFSENEIFEWIAKAPSEFQMKAPNPDHDIIIGGKYTEFAPGYGAPKIVSTAGSVRNATISDYITFLQLTQASEYFHLNGGPLVQPEDIPASANMAAMVYLTHRHSDKCLLVPNGDDEEIRLLMDMLQLLYGDSFRQKNAVTITILNPISPLQIDQNALNILFQFARHGQPVIISAAPMGGTTGPMTLEGCVALANAEVLATIAAHQMIRPGAPVVYGARASVADMRTGGSIVGSAERTLCSIYASRLAKAYNLPCRNSGAENDAATVNAQSGYESMLNMMPAVYEKMNLIIHSAGTLGGFGAMSVAKFIVDLEIIGLVKRLLEGVDVGPNKLALEVVEAVGPAGNFLTQDHTLAHCRTEARPLLIGSRGILGDQGTPSYFEKSIEKVKQDLLRQYAQPESTQASALALKKMLTDKGLPIQHLLDA